MSEERISKMFKGADNKHPKIIGASKAVIVGRRQTCLDKSSI